MRRTKIVCTLGPASSEPEVLTQLLAAGMDVARINFSHGDHQTHAETIRRIRTLATERDRPVAILGDLQGPKLRVGELPEAGVVLQVGERVLLSTEPDTPDSIPLLYPNLPQVVSPGDRMLLDDGLLELEVREAGGNSILAEVITGGVLYSHKGVNLPKADTRIPAITDKDRADLRFAIEQELDWVALSFVRTQDEVLELREMIRQQAPSGLAPKIIAKIEKPEAVAHFDAILQAVDGVMVARGDLGIEMPTEDVPLIQKRIIRESNEAGKPVITATQMLDSMIRNPRPTRAEASDVANAVLDGTDAVMLSGETAVGAYPALTVTVMDRIVRRAEQLLSEHPRHPEASEHIDDPAQALAQAAADLAMHLGAAAIITPTVSGYTACQVSRYRPCLPIIAVTPNAMVRRQINLLWGVYPLLSPRQETTDGIMTDAVHNALAHDMVQIGDLVVITSGTAGSSPGTTDLLKLHVIENE
jgi:pyruvate kinase